MCAIMCVPSFAKKDFVINEGFEISIKMINIVNNLLYANAGWCLHPYTLISGAIFLNEGVTLSLGLVTGDFYFLFMVDS